jgi:hypothetical protein
VENLPRLFTMFFKGVAEEDGEVVTSLMLVLVVLLGFDRRGSQRSTRGFGCTQSEVLVVVQVVEDLVVRCVKGTVVGGFEGSQNEGPKDVVYGERAHVLKSSADIDYFAKVGVNRSRHPRL